MIKFFCLLIFRITGWKFRCNLPDDLRSFILVGGPHTSNWDFVPGMAASVLLKRNAKFVIKHTWLKFPFNLLMKPAGAIGVDRAKAKEGKLHTTDLIAALFKDFPELVIMISPEGTRGPNDKWKTGFYQIAVKAQIPLVLGVADWGKKEVFIGQIVYPTDLEKDMRTITEFFRHAEGKIPENFKLDQRYS